ncbi:hypothetical protein LSAT2_026880 [Lamellibrachia satsuma]|nr:hypothetical protein LSAT2_026880 [Lamellibrachia satsuma]
MFKDVLKRYRLQETKLTDLWTLLTMDQHYNCCWHTSQRRVDNLGANFQSRNTRLPEVTREGTARLWVSNSQYYPSRGTPTTPKCLTRASGLTDRCCGCRRHDALIPSASERSRSTDRQMSPATLTPTRANVCGNIHRRRRSRRCMVLQPSNVIGDIYRGRR